MVLARASPTRGLVEVTGELACDARGLVLALGAVVHAVAVVVVVADRRVGQQVGRRALLLGGVEQPEEVPELLLAELLELLQ